MFERKPTTHIVITTGTMIRAVLVVLGVFLIWHLRDLVLVLLTSIVVASFVESAVPFFRRMRISRVLGIVILYIFGLLFMFVMLYLFLPLMFTEIYNFSFVLSSYVPGIYFLDYFQNEAFSGAKDVVANLSHDLSLTSLVSVSQAFINNLSGGFLKTLSVAFGGLVNFSLIILISFYLSVEEKGIENFLRIIFPLRYENYVVDLWDRSSRKIALWVKGQMLLAVLIGVLTYLVLSLLNVQYALLLSMIAGIMELVPYGILVALIPAVSFSYLSGGIGKAFVVALAYIIIHQFEVFLFSPLVIKKVVGLSPIVIILAALIGFELAGLWGVVLAIPMAVIFVELSNDIEKRKIFVREHKEHDEQK